MAEPKRDRTTSAPAASDDDCTPPGVDLGPRELTPEQRAEAAELAKARAAIDRAIRREAELKELRAIREAIASVGRQDGTQDQEQDEPPKKPGERIYFVLQKVLYPPDGKAPADLMNKQIIDAVKDEFGKRHWKLPGDETIRHIVVDEIGRS